MFSHTHMKLQQCTRFNYPKKRPAVFSLAQVKLRYWNHLEIIYYDSIMDSIPSVKDIGNNFFMNFALI